MSGDSAECKKFRNDIHAYNSVLAFTFIGVEINELISYTQQMHK